VIVVHALHRMGRTVRDTLNLIHELTERAVGVRNLANPIRVDSFKPDDSMGQLAVVLLALLAQVERTYTLERAAHARAVAAAKGRRVGRPVGGRPWSPPWAANPASRPAAIPPLPTPTATGATGLIFIGTPGIEKRPPLVPQARDALAAERASGTGSPPAARAERRGVLRSAASQRATRKTYRQVRCSGVNLYEVGEIVSSTEPDEVSNEAVPPSLNTTWSVLASNWSYSTCPPCTQPTPANGSPSDVNSPSSPRVNVPLTSLQPSEAVQRPSLWNVIRAELVSKLGDR
jgi:hypothetical protein